MVATEVVTEVVVVPVAVPLDVVVVELRQAVLPRHES